MATSDRYDDPRDFPMRGGMSPPPARKRRKHKIHHRPKSSISSGAARSEINVTPLVDVVLVLLIIFMVVTPMLHRGVHIDLPVTEHHDKKQDTGEQLIISVRNDGVYIETDRVADAPEVGKDGKQPDVKVVEALIARFRKDMHDGARPAFVRADRKLKYGQVRFVLEQLHNAGASNVSMQTEDHP
jgi:biopolymer transport protein TolR